MPTKNKKEPADLTAEEKKIIAETQILEKRETLPQKTGIVLTGGIDSAVTLCKLKSTIKMELQPIAFEGSDQDAIKKILEKEGITESVKEFENPSTIAGKKEVLQWCFENNISPLAFGANIEEYNHNIGTEEMQEWREISSEMNNYGVQIVEPLHAVNKSVIIQMAKEYGILDLTAKPSDSSKFKKIRDDAFKEARIDDPHVEQETEKVS